MPESLIELSPLAMLYVIAVSSTSSDHAADMRAASSSSSCAPYDISTATSPDARTDVRFTSAI